MMPEKSFTLSELAKALEADLQGSGKIIIKRLATLKNATPDSISFITNPAYQKYLDTTKAGAVILSPEIAQTYSGNALVHNEPYLIFAKATHLFDNTPKAESGISSSAHVATDACIHPSVTIRPGAIIESGVHIAENVVIGPGTFVGKETQIGSDTLIKSNVNICHNSIIGSHCIIHEGVVIGSDGFGFAHNGKNWLKIVQLGRTIIGNHVEIGANTTIDRGTLEDTVVEDHVILDNQIQIAHNVKIGRNTAIAANTGIAGSATIGSGCMIGGGAGINGHISIADGVKLSGMAVVTKSITEANSEWSPGVINSASLKNWRKNIVRFHDLNNLFERVKILERKAASINKTSSNDVREVKSFFVEGCKESKSMLIEEIKELLPQRYPFLLIDRVVEVDLQQQSIIGYKNVSANEHFFNGHFPGRPIMPGVLIIEAMAQAAGILGFSLEGKKEGDLYLFAGADKVKFRHLVVPGDCLELKAQLLTKKRHISKFACQALVHGKLACSAEVTCAKKEM